MKPRPDSRLHRPHTTWHEPGALRSTPGLALADQEVRSTEVTRSYAEVLAPFAGMVVARSVEPGILALPGTPMFTIEREGAYRLEASVEESRLSAIRVGQPVSVTLDNLDHTLEARVSEIVPAVDAASRAYIVKIDLPALATLRSGVFGRAGVSVGKPIGDGDSGRGGRGTRPVAIRIRG